MGLDSREITPRLTKAIVHIAADVRSFARAEAVIKNSLDIEVSDSTIRRITEQVGSELADLAESERRTDGKQVVTPSMAVVSCDGGRIRTREAGKGRGVTLANETGWRETKNASFEKSHLNKDYVENHDPCEALPSSFRSAAKVANIAEKPVPNVVESEENPSNSATDKPAEKVVYAGPERVLRTAVSSLACSDDFGPMMHKEAQRRRFFEAPLRVFIGDGLNWNWSIWKTHFSTFIPILDFIHAIQYIFAAAMAMAINETEGWAAYVRLTTLCWQGQVHAVIEELRAVLADRDIAPDAKLPDNHRLKPLIDAVRYLTNNQDRMNYPQYRRLGLPVTSAPMESLIKQMNMRVKGTEMFWDEPAGAEAILHVRAAALSEDDRLNDYLHKRPGWPYVRRTTLTTAA
jgi:hypothetical protein